MTTVSRPDSAPPIVIRQMGFTFEDLPRHWFGDDPLRTHVINGLHFVFPAGERFFIRSIKPFVAGLPAELRERVRGFSGQEAHHQLEHRRAFEAIEAQGYDVRSFLRWYERLAYELIEPRMSELSRLATTAALEHYTAILGEFALSSLALDECHPVMRELLMWHACEEIEHKAVTFDVLQHVDPRYRTRLAGFLIATPSLFFFWGAGIRHMLAQEPRSPRGRRSRRARKKALDVITSTAAFLAPRALEYLRPSFHPDDHDTYELARQYLEAIGRLEA